MTTLGRTLVAILSCCTVTVGAGCTNKVVKRTTATAALAIIAADWCQTRGIAGQGWPGGRMEGGWPTGRVIGPNPEPFAVDMWFAFSTGLFILAAEALPEKYEVVAYGLGVITQGYNLWFYTNIGIAEGRRGCF